MKKKSPLFWDKKWKGTLFKKRAQLILPHQSQRKSNSKKLLKIYSEKMNYYVPIERGCEGQ